MTPRYLIGEWNELETKLNSAPLDYRVFIKQIVVLQKLLNAGATTLPDGRDIQELLAEYSTIKEQIEADYPFLKEGQEPSRTRQSL